MSAQPDFLIQFQEKMQKLQEIRKNIQQSVKFKTQFTNDLKGKLGEINQRLSILSSLIGQLKDRADNLEKQIGNNANSVSDKEKQIEKLTKQIAVITGEKEQLTQEMNKYKQEKELQIADQQKKIDDFEAQIRDLTQQKEAAVNESTALKKELAGRGDEQAMHAKQIDELTKKSQLQLEEQEKQLTVKINECEQKIVNFEKQLQDKENEHNQTKQQLEQLQNQSQDQSTNLQKQVEQLNQQNQQLVERLVAATEAIHQATEDLAMLTESVPNVTTKAEVDELLNGITQKIEQSIEQIGRAAQGQPPHSEGGVTPLNPNDGHTQGIPPNEIININGENIAYGQLIQMLRTKDKQVRKRDPNNKYKQALDRLKTITSGSQVESALTESGVIFKNNVVSGGRKTKKNRKQKGGFIYKTSFKRKNITSHLTPKKMFKGSFKRSFKTTSKRSSKRSSKRTLR
jgi:archaellum component FlaC